MKTLNYENVVLWGVLLLIGSALTAKKVVQVLSVKADFKKKMTQVAKDEQARSGIHPDITITQAAHESNWGQSELTVKANNLFGFTGESWEAAGKPVIKLPTLEYINGQKKTVNRPFRAYKSWAESVRDWGSVISGLSIYKQAYAFAKAGNVPEFAKAVQAAGYATDPNYSDKLTNVYASVKSIPDVVV